MKKVTACFLVLLCYSCISKKEIPIIEKAQADSITFIFDKFPLLSHEKKFVSGATMRINVQDFVFRDRQKYISLTPRFEPENDTIIVSTSSEQVLVKHRINLAEVLEFIFKKGDTVLFTYSNDIPIASVINRKTLDYELNWESKFRNEILKNRNEEFSSSARYFIPELSAKSIMEIDFKKNKHRLYPVFKKDLEDEIKFLDSIHGLKLIPEEVFDYYIDRDQYKLLALEVENDKLDSLSIKKIIDNYDKALTTPYSHFDYFIGVVVNKLFIEEAKLINTGSGFTRDFRVSFDRIQKSTMFPKELKDKILFQQISQIASAFSLKDFTTYYEKFKSANPDTSLVNIIRSNYLLDFEDVRNLSHDLFLVSLGKKRNTLDSIKYSNKGKLIYIDFWASWCGPCREAMPSSIKLKEKYADKVAFVYLSSDRDFDKWKLAAIEEGLEFYKDSYLMLNSSSSDFLTQLSFKAIPRYLLFDRQGNLVHKNAPGPGSKEIEKLIDQYMSN